MKDNTDTSIRGSVLSEAKATTCGPREEAYGNVYDNMQGIAGRWEAYLNNNMRVWRPTAMSPSQQNAGQ